MPGFIKRHAALAAAFALALVVTVFFAVRFFDSAPRWRHPPPDDQPIAGWMTPRMIVMSRHVDVHVVDRVLNLPDERGDGRIPLSQIAASQGRDLDQMIQELEAAIAEERGHDGN